LIALLSLAGCSGSDADTAAAGSSGSAGASASAGAAGSSGTAGTGGAAGSGGVSGSAGAGGATGVTFHEQVEPIIQAKCQTCHQDGGIAGFSLQTYTKVKAYAPDILLQISSKAMPPWGQDDTSECTHKRPFRDDHRLTQDEIDLITQWHADGDLEGNPANAPAPIDLSPPKLQNITDTLTPTNDYFLQAGAQDDLRCFIIDPHMTEDTWVDGTNVDPGDPRVVHHVLVFTDPSRASLGLDEGNGSYQCFGGPGVDGSLMMAWAPGIQPNDYAPNALKVAKDSLLVMQVHYHRLPTTDVHDKTAVQLRRKPTKPDYEAQIYLIGNFDAQDADGMGLQPGPDDPTSTPEFVIPANSPAHTEDQVFEIPAGTPPIPLAAIGTHMHWVGTDMKITVERKNPTNDNPADECLLQTPRYDFNWQRAYFYDTPINQLPTLAGGDRLHMKCTFNNTMSNPKLASALAAEHLSAPIDVRLGEQTTDEMCLGAFVLLVPTAFGP
jgi:hypothetical protein